MNAEKNHLMQTESKQIVFITEVLSDKLFIQSDT